MTRRARLFFAVAKSSPRHRYNYRSRCLGKRRRTTIVFRKTYVSPGPAASGFRVVNGIRILETHTLRPAAFCYFFELPTSYDNVISHTRAKKTTNGHDDSRLPNTHVRFDGRRARWPRHSRGAKIKNVPSNVSCDERGVSESSDVVAVLRKSIFTELYWMISTRSPAGIFA